MLDQPALQQHQARLQVVSHVRQTQGGVQPQFTVGELGASQLGKISHQFPEDGAGHAFDQVGVVDENAVIGGKAAHLQRRPRHRRLGQRHRGGVHRFVGCLHQIDGRAQMPGYRHQRVLVLKTELQIVRAFDKQHTQQASDRHHRNGQLAVRLGQAGIRNIGLQRDRRRIGAYAAAHGAAVGIGGGHAQYAHRRALTGGHADHAIAHLDFRPHAGYGVAATGHREQALRDRVQHQHHGMAHAHEIGQAGQRGVQQFVQSRATRQALAAAAHRIERVAALRRRRQGVPFHRFDLQHLINVRTQQLEHMGHAGVRGNAGQLRFHALKQGALRLGVQVAQMDAEKLGRGRMQHQHRGVRIGQDVLPRLVEKLERQGHMALIHIVGLRDVGHVGRAVAATGGHDGGYGALQAMADGAQLNTAFHHPRPPVTGAPALGLGVWSKATSGSKLRTTRSPSRYDSMARVKAAEKPTRLTSSSMEAR
jgi:hypothetical protein